MQKQLYVKNRENYKSVSPMQTVHNIRRILHDNDLFLLEARWFNSGKDFCSSVGILMPDAGFTTAGKGMNERYALASGYAEFMERLQNLFIIRQNFYTGKQPIKGVYVPDRKPFHYKEYKKKHADMLKIMFNVDDLSKLDFFEKHEKNVGLAAFYSVYSNQVEYLPLDLIILSAGSNGLCAGNTSEEAIIQGLCEIFERYVLKEIYFNKDISLPNVPDDVLKRYPQWRYIEVLRHFDFKVYVKDCSLDGTVPVVGTVIMKDEKALLNLGSSPDFSIALERCFTELFQGFNIHSIEAKLNPLIPLENENFDKKFHDQSQKELFHYYNQLRKGAGYVPLTVLDDRKAFNEANLFLAEDVIHKATLKKLVDRAKALGRDLYIRDVSFLGFPTFHVYMPGISDALSIKDYDSVKHFRLIVEEAPKARNIFFNLKNATKHEIRYLISTLESIIEDPFIEYDTTLRLLSNLRLDDDVVLNNLDPENLLVLLYYKIDEVEKAYAILKEYLERKLTKDQLSYPPDFAVNHVCLLKILEQLVQGNSFENIKKNLTEKFPGEMLNEIVSVLESGDIAGYLDIPHCENCQECKYRRICTCETVVNFSRKIQKKVEEYHFDQTRLSAILN